MNKVIRYQPIAGLRLRSEGSERKAVGYAAVFDSWTRVGGGKGFEVREVIKPGAFRNALIERQDVRALWNHKPESLLGRTASGTLKLAEDARGLWVEIDLPETTVGRDVAESIRRGDASQMSFAYLPRPGGEAIKKRLENGIEVSEVTITDANLFDVSIVTYAAYGSTSVELRSGGGMTDRQRRAATMAHLRSKNREMEARLGPLSISGRLR